MAAEVEEVRIEEGRTMSDLVREALRRYMEEREWRTLLKYGEEQVKRRGISPEDVERLVHEYRSETARRARRP
jgi:metal-responsive CopG/Arc/MetJ family transcriptional regulator